MSNVYSETSIAYVNGRRDSLASIASPQEWYINNFIVFTDFIPTRSSSRVFL